MSAYIAQLNAAVAREQAQHAEKERAAAEAVRERLRFTRRAPPQNQGLNSHVSKKRA